MSIDTIQVSVVIPVFNEAGRLADAISLAWRAGAFEVIVVDGGSCDGSQEVASQAKCRLIQASQGRAQQQNHGAAESRGNVLLFLHADNWLEANAIEQITLAVERDEVFAGGFQQAIDSPGRIYRLLEKGNAMRVRRLGLAYGDQGIFVRRDVFESLGGFPEIPLMEDVRLMRALRRLQRPVLLPGPLHVSARRWQQHGVLRQTLRNWALLAAEKIGVSPERLTKYYAAHQ